MRKNNLLVLIVVAGLFVFACDKKQTEEQASEVTSETADVNEWAEMDAFHMIMAESFHPYKDSANLEPVKRLAEEMAVEAESWAAKELPSKVNNDDMKAKIQQLKSDTRSLADKIKSGASDEEIGTSLNALHDSFHTIMESWNGGGEESHEHKH